MKALDFLLQIFFFFFAVIELCTAGSAFFVIPREVTTTGGTAPALFLLGEPGFDPDLLYAVEILEYGRMVRVFVLFE